ncbi:MAG: type II secretion system protein GspK [Planctomycetaceae bacterium]
MNTIEVAEVSYGLGNESARFNLAQLMTIDQMSPLGGRTALMSLPGMTEIAADSILDWIDADDLPREFGAESEYYQELPNPYRPRNSLPTTLDELLLVRGVHRALLYGPDKNRNFRIDDDEQQAAQLIEQLTQTEEETQLEGQGWTDCLTLHSAERDDDRFGVPRINLNQPDLSQLHMELSEVLPAEVVEFIIHWRQYGPAPAGVRVYPQTTLRTCRSPSAPFYVSRGHRRSPHIRNDESHSRYDRESGHTGVTR